MPTGRSPGSPAGAAREWTPSRHFLIADGTLWPRGEASRPQYAVVLVGHRARGCGCGAMRRDDRGAWHWPAVDAERDVRSGRAAGRDHGDRFTVTVILPVTVTVDVADPCFVPVALTDAFQAAQGDAPRFQVADAARCSALRAVHRLGRKPGRLHRRRRGDQLGSAADHLDGRGHVQRRCAPRPSVECVRPEGWKHVPLSGELRRRARRFPKSVIRLHRRWAKGVEPADPLHRQRSYLWVVECVRIARRRAPRVGHIVRA